MKRILSIAAIAALMPLTALADDGLKIDDPYARVSGEKATSGAAFMVIKNDTDAACTLTAVKTDVADRVELHRHTMDKEGVMKMEAIEGGIEIPAKGEHALDRGGDHVMLMGLTKPLVDGESFDATFDFGDCGTVDAAIKVDSARKPDGGHGEHMHHGDHQDGGHEVHEDGEHKH